MKCPDRKRINHWIVPWNLYLMSWGRCSEKHPSSSVTVQTKKLRGGKPGTIWKWKDVQKGYLRQRQFDISYSQTCLSLWRRTQSCFEHGRYYDGKSSWNLKLKASANFSLMLGCPPLRLEEEIGDQVPPVKLDQSVHYFCTTRYCLRMESGSVSTIWVG